MHRANRKKKEMKMKLLHVGIPTTKTRTGETFLEGAGVYVTDAAASPYQIEWLRFTPDSGMPAELKNNTHVAFEVENLDAAMKGKKVILPPFSPMEGVMIAFIEDDGLVVELLQKCSGCSCSSCG